MWNEFGSFIMAVANEIPLVAETIKGKPYDITIESAGFAMRRNIVGVFGNQRFLFALILC